MNQLCPVKSLCIDPANPVQNFSSEAPDPVQFISINTGWDLNDPPIGGTWDSANCQFICTSTISQADADQCAANGQLVCTDVGGNWNNPPGVPVQNALNDSETCVSLCPDGLAFTFTVPAGTILAQNRATADHIAGALACQNARLRRICMSSLTPSEACINSAYSGHISASGGLLSPTSNTWTLAGGSLPDGLNFTGSSGVGPFQHVVTGTTLGISGTPTAAGNFRFTVRVTAPNGDFMQKQYSICVIDISPATLPSPVMGTPYSQTLTATGCATPTLSWQVVSGTLPPGLSLAEGTGVISGTPTTGADFNITVQVQTSST